MCVTRKVAIFPQTFNAIVNSYSSKYELYILYKWDYFFTLFTDKETYLEYNEIHTKEIEEFYLSCVRNFMEILARCYHCVIIYCNNRISEITKFVK